MLFAARDKFCLTYLNGMSTCKYQRLLNKDIRQLPPDNPRSIFLTLSHPRLEHDKEPMVPCRIISYVLYQHRIHEIKFSAPQVLVVEEC